LVAVGFRYDDEVVDDDELHDENRTCSFFSVEFFLVIIQPFLYGLFSYREK